MYVTADDVREVLKGTAGDIPAAADKLEDEQINVEIENAQSQVDGALRHIYSVPFVTVPDVVKYITRDIAAFLCDLTFRMSKDYGSALSPIVLRYQRATGLLTSIGSGNYILDVDDSVVKTDGSLAINPYDGDLITVQHLFGPAVFG